MQDTENINKLTTNDWLNERQRWTAFYEQHLSERLNWAIEYVNQQSKQSNNLSIHLNSLFNLIQQARSHTKFYFLAVRLIAALHPLPLRLGFWESWEQHLDFAAQISADITLPTRQVDFLTDLAVIMFYTGRFSQALTLSEQALMLARELHSAKAMVTACGPLISSLHYLGRSSEANLILTELENERLIQLTTEPIAQAQLGLQRVIILRQQGRMQEAITKINNILTNLEQLADVDTYFLAQAYRDRAVLLRAQGEGSKAIRDLERARKLFIECNEIFGEAQTLSNLGLVYWHLADLAKAEKSLRASIELLESMEANNPARLETGKLEIVMLLGNLGLIYLSRGDLNQALVYLERQLFLATNLGHAGEISRATGNRGVVRLHLGEYELARTDLEADVAFTKAQTKQEGLISAYVNLSWCLFCLDQPESALHLAEQAYEIASKSGAIPMKVIALRCLADFQSNLPKKLLLEQALHLARQHGLKLDAAACLLGLAGLAENQAEQAKLWLAAARLLKRIGAAGWLKNHSPQNPPRLPALV